MSKISTPVAAHAHRPVKERIATIDVFLANGFVIGAWAVEVPCIKESLALSDTSLGIALFAFALGAIVAMPLAPRFGSGRVTALLGVIFVIMLPMPALAPDFPLLCFALLVLGASNGALDVSMNGHASTIETKWQALIMSSFHAVWSAVYLRSAVFSRRAASCSCSAGRPCSPRGSSLRWSASALPISSP